MEISLKQAFIHWQTRCSSMANAVMTRLAFQKVFLKGHEDVDLCKFNKSYVSDILRRSREDDACKTKATSLLTHILCLYAKERPDVFSNPEFTFDLVSELSSAATRQSKVPVGVVASSATVKRSAFRSMPRPTKSTRSLPVAQVNPSTNTVVKRYKSCSSAQRATGIKNIGRAAYSHRILGGFLWRFLNDSEAKSFCEDVASQSSAEFSVKKNMQ